MGVFDGARLLGSTRRSIVLQTHQGREVLNSIEPEPGEQERRRHELLLRKHGGQWKQRKPPTGVYNCAGHVWANRRTAIIDDLNAQVEVILTDDGYRKLGPNEQPRPGDLVIYRDRDAGIGFLHVGLIVSLGDRVSPESPPIPWVLSKWDSAAGEFAHRVPDVPFDRDVFDLVTEYWTDCPPS